MMGSNTNQGGIAIIVSSNAAPISSHLVRRTQVEFTESMALLLSYIHLLILSFSLP
jgi:hypothetical protein